MEILSFLYNIFLIVLYTVVLSYSIFLYFKKRKPVFLILAVLFLFYVFDNTIIYMTEFIDSFSVHYDIQFMSIPAFKTVIIVVSCVCMTLLQHVFLPKRNYAVDIAGLIILSLMLLFTPMLKDSAFKVWLYYLPYQSYMFYLGISGFLYIKKRPELLAEDKFLAHYKKIALLTALSTIFILIEDTIVIYSFDVYSDILVKINNRSLTEDFMSIILSLFAIKHLSFVMWAQAQEVKTQSQVKTVTDIDLTHGMDTMALNDMISIEDTENTENLKDAEAPEGETITRKIVPVMSVYRKELDPVFYNFASDYHLTGREQDILKVLLKDKNNQEISNELFISVGTVKTHVHNIFQKVGVTKRSQLLRMYGAYGEEYRMKAGSE